MNKLVKAFPDLSLRTLLLLLGDYVHAIDRIEETDGERSGYVNGVLDMFNETQKEMDKCQAGKTQSAK